MTTKATVLVLHAIHAVPASALNRDDAGAIKRIHFGGAVRVRVSSQSWKRAIRTLMRETAIDGGAYGMRTTRFPQLVAERLAADHGRPLDIATARTGAVFAALKLALTDKGTTAAPVYAAETLPARMAAALDAHWDAFAGNGIGESGATSGGVPAALVAAARTALDVANTADLALFGRMLAGIPEGRVDGAAGVAHAFSVDPLAVEPDLFTTVDDAAAGYAVSNLGVVQLAAPVLYRCAYLDRRLLRRHLASAANPETLAAAVEAGFVDAFIRAVPSGARRSTVPATLPSLVSAVTGPQAISAADAFATAIRSDTVVPDACVRLLAALDRQTHIVPGLAVHHLAPDAALPEPVTGVAHTRSADFIAAVAAS